MSDESQTPTPDDLIGKGIDKLVSLRPRALQWINGGQGIYASVFAGWRAQAALMCRRTADFALNGRLPFSAGASLRFLAGSEFDTLSDLSPTTAIGHVVLTRASGRPGGTIKAGSRFARPADPSPQTLYPDALYNVASDTAVAQGAMTVTVPLVAAREGSFANRPNIGDAQNELVIADNIVDSTAWTVSFYEMGGGSDGVSDGDIQQYAQAFALGQYGPTDRAIIAGALRAGAKHAIAIDDPSTGTLQLYIADLSWGGSARWAAMIQQSMRDAKLVGFGCKVATSSVTNTVIQIAATVKVRIPDSLADTSPLDAAIQKALRRYFDTRPDFNKWSLTALRGVISRADRRLLSCSSVAVTTPGGVTVPEPTTDSPVHFLLINSGVSVTYENPN